MRTFKTEYHNVNQESLGMADRYNYNSSENRKFQSDINTQHCYLDEISEESCKPPLRIVASPNRIKTQVAKISYENSMQSAWLSARSNRKSTKGSSNTNYSSSRSPRIKNNQNILIMKPYPRSNTESQIDNRLRRQKVPCPRLMKSSISQSCEELSDASKKRSETATTTSQKRRHFIDPKVELAQKSAREKELIQQRLEQLQKSSKMILRKNLQKKFNNYKWKLNENENREDINSTTNDSKSTQRKMIESKIKTRLTTNHQKTYEKQIENVQKPLTEGNKKEVCCELNKTIISEEPKQHPIMPEYKPPSESSSEGPHVQFKISEELILHHQQMLSQSKVNSESTSSSNANKQVCEKNEGIFHHSLPDSYSGFSRTSSSDCGYGNTVETNNSKTHPRIDATSSVSTNLSSLDTNDSGLQSRFSSDLYEVSQTSLGITSDEQNGRADVLLMSSHTSDDNKRFTLDAQKLKAENLQPKPRKKIFSTLSSSLDTETSSPIKYDNLSLQPQSTAYSISEISLDTPSGRLDINADNLATSKNLTKEEIFMNKIFEKSLSSDIDDINAVNLANSQNLTKDEIFMNKCLEKSLPSDIDDINADNLATSQNLTLEEIFMNKCLKKSLSSHIDDINADNLATSQNLTLEEIIMKKSLLSDIDDNQLRFWLLPDPKQMCRYSFVTAVRNKLEAAAKKTLITMPTDVDPPDDDKLNEECIKNIKLNTHSTLSSLVQSEASDTSKSSSLLRNSTQATSEKISSSSSLTNLCMESNAITSKSDIQSKNIPDYDDDDETTVSSSVFDSPQKKFAAIDKYDESLLFLQSSEGERMQEAIAGNHVIINRGDSPRSDHSETSEINLSKLLIDFNRSLSQAIDVNKQLKHKTSKDPRTYKADTKTRSHGSVPKDVSSFVTSTTDDELRNNDTFMSNDTKNLNTLQRIESQTTTTTTTTNDLTSAEISAKMYMQRQTIWRKTADKDTRKCDKYSFHHDDGDDDDDDNSAAGVKHKIIIPPLNLKTSDAETDEVQFSSEYFEIVSESDLSIKNTTSATDSCRTETETETSYKYSSNFELSSPNFTSEDLKQHNNSESNSSECDETLKKKSKSDEDDYEYDDDISSSQETCILTSINSKRSTTESSRETKDSIVYSSFKTTDTENLECNNILPRKADIFNRNINVSNTKVETESSEKQGKNNQSTEESSSLSQCRSSPNNDSDVYAIINRSDVEISISSLSSSSSIGWYQKLKQSEATKSEHLKTMLEIREKVLLDRTKSQIAWLEIQKERYKTEGLINHIATIKKKQRALLLKMDKERSEIKQLLHKTFKSKQDHISPIKSISCTSRKSVRHNFDDKSLTRSGTEISRIESSRSLEEVLKKREFDLQRRRKYLEGLIKWDQRLNQEEAEVVQLEKKLISSKNALIRKDLTTSSENVTPKQNEVTSSSRHTLKMQRRLQEIDNSLRELNDISRSSTGPESNSGISEDSSDYVSTTGLKLNKLWRRLTSQKIDKFEPNHCYKLCKADVERIYEDAKIAVLNEFEQGDKRIARELFDKSVDATASENEKTSENLNEEPKNIMDKSTHQESETSDNQEGRSDMSVDDKSSFTKPCDYCPCAVESNLSSAHQSSDTGTEGTLFSAHEEIVARNELIEQNIKKFITMTKSLIETQSGLQRSLSDNQISIIDIDHYENLMGKFQHCKSISTINTERSSTASSNEEPLEEENCITTDVEEKEEEEDTISLTSNEVLEENSSSLSAISTINLSSSNEPSNICSIGGESNNIITIKSPVQIQFNMCDQSANMIPTDCVEKSSWTYSSSAMVAENSDSTSIESSSLNDVENESLPSPQSSINFEETFVVMQVSNEIPSSESDKENAERFYTKEISPDNISADDSESGETNENKNEQCFDNTESELSRLEDESMPQLVESLLETTTDEISLIADDLEAKSRTEPVPLLTAQSGAACSSTLQSSQSGSPSKKGSTQLIPNSNSTQLMPDIINNLDDRRCQQQVPKEPERKQYENVPVVPYVYMREIPNKPPPPYVPPAPGSPMTTIFPSEERIKDITFRRCHELYCQLTKKEYTNSKGEKLPSVMDEKITNIYERIILDICREYLEEHMEVLTQGHPAHFHTQLAFFNPPDRLRCIQNAVYKEVRRCLSMNKSSPKRPKVFSIYGQRAKRDHIGKIIIEEMNDEEDQWCNFHKEENEVIQLVVEEMISQEIYNVIREAWTEFKGETEELSSSSSSSLLPEKIVTGTETSNDVVNINNEYESNISQTNNNNNNNNDNNSNSNNNADSVSIE